MNWFSALPKHLPQATGRYVPGCTDVMLDYAKNGIFMRLYYPTAIEKTDKENYKKWITWLPDDSYLIGLSKVLMIFPFLIRVAFFPSMGIKIPVLYGEKPKFPINKLKCIVFSHGLGGHRFLYSNICCELASRGFLVVALEHRDNSSSNTYYFESKKDACHDLRSTIDHINIEFGKDHHGKRSEQVHYRAEECSKAIDFIIELNGGTVPYNVMKDVPGQEQVRFELEDFVGRIDLDSLTMVGHSFGGATALLAMSKRCELKQGILLDPWMFPIKSEGLDKKVKQDLIFINTQTFHIKSNVNAMEKYLDYEKAKREMYTILHTTHEHQTDSVLLIGSWLNWFMKKLNPIVALKLNNNLMLRFLKQRINYPENIEDCEEYLEEHKSNIEFGLTKPWA